jgi:ferritin
MKWNRKILKICAAAVAGRQGTTRNTVCYAVKGCTMEIKKKMQDSLNRQINRELYSGYLYLAMSAYFEDKSLKGFAKWMRIQANEELKHAMKLYGYVFERAGRVTLSEIEAPAASWNSPLDAFKEAYMHEQAVTAMIYALVDMAKSEKDHATDAFLKWYVDEQVEEEATPLDIVKRLELIGDSANGLLMLDKELRKREE